MLARRRLSIACRSRGSPSDTPEMLTSNCKLGVLLDQFDRMGHDPLVDLGDQAEALGDIEERGWRDQFALVIEHPKQELVLSYAKRLQIEDRLGEQCERGHASARTRCG